MVGILVFKSANSLFLGNEKNIDFIGKSWPRMPFLSPATTWPSP